MNVLAECLDEDVAKKLLLGDQVDWYGWNFMTFGRANKATATAI
jgi:hypothetical protein